MVFAAMDYKMYADEVVAFHKSEASIRIPTAPARSSKSYSAAPEVVYRALPHRPLLGSLQWLVGTDYPTNKEFQYVWKWLVEERERWTMGGHPIVIEKAHNNPQNGNMIIVIDWGKDKKYGRAKAIIEGKSSTNERALQGEHVTQCVLSEAAEHDRRIWEKYLSTRSTWAIFPTTPKPHAEWLHEMCEIGEKDPSLSIESFVFPYWANPYYDEDRYKREEKKAARRAESGKAEDDPYFAEQFHPFGGVQQVPPQECLQGQAGFSRRDALAQPCFQMRVVAQRVEFAGQHLFQVRLGDLWMTDHEGVGGQIAQALASSV